MALALLTSVALATVTDGRLYLLQGYDAGC